MDKQLHGRMETPMWVMNLQMLMEWSQTIASRCTGPANGDHIEIGAIVLEGKMLMAVLKLITFETCSTGRVIKAKIC